MASVFTKIINNELPSYKIYEDHDVIAILALDQVNLGHTLVIPKKEVDHWFDVPADIMTKLTLISQKIAKAIKTATGCPRIGTITAGFEVNHYHLHMIPAWSIPDLDFKRAQKRTSTEMEEIQKKIKNELSLLL